MVNYPHKVAKKTLVSTQRKHPVDFANRGMTFEKMINESNQYYLSRGLAVIHKKPTPIQIVKVDYPRRSRAKIVEAYFRQGGICFVLLHFAKLSETYLLPAPALIHYYNIDHGSKSMPLSYIQEHGFLVDKNRLPSVPYLDIIEQKLLGGI